MDLKRAIARAASYADHKHLTHSLVMAEEGRLHCSDGITGIQVRCEDIDGMEPFCVPARQWAAQIGALVGDPQIKLTDKMVTTSAGSAKFRLQRVDDHRPRKMATPKKDWVTVPADAVRGIAAISPLVSEVPLGAWASTGVCLDPDWVGCASGERAAILWAPGLVENRVVVRPDLFAGLTEEVSLAVRAKAVWVTANDEARWTVPMEGGWPDTAILGGLTQARAGSCTFMVDLAEFQLALAQVLVETSSLALPTVVLTVDKANGVLGLKAKGTLSDVVASVGVDVVEAGDDEISVACSSKYLKLCVDALVSGSTTAVMTMGGSVMPICLCAGEACAGVVVEALVVPVRLDG